LFFFIGGWLLIFFGVIIEVFGRLMQLSGAAETCCMWQVACGILPVVGWPEWGFFEPETILNGTDNQSLSLVREKCATT